MKAKFYTISIITLIFEVFNAQAQTNTFPATGSAGIGTTSPNASAALEIKSTTQGLLISRMTQTQRNAIVSPAIGLMIYQTTNTPGFYYYDGSWKPVTPKSKGWQLTGNSGTDTAINFLGTIDAMPLIIKVNNQRAGYLDFSPSANTSFGFRLFGQQYQRNIQYCYWLKCTFQKHEWILQRCKRVQCFSKQYNGDWKCC
jgi:hypothetical protein